MTASFSGATDEARYSSNRSATAAASLRRAVLGCQSARMRIVIEDDEVHLPQTSPPKAARTRKFDLTPMARLPCYDRRRAARRPEPVGSQNVAQRRIPKIVSPLASAGRARAGCQFPRLTGTLGPRAPYTLPVQSGLLIVSA